MDKKSIDLILIFLIFILLVSTIYLIFIFKKDGFECLANPINYFENLKNSTCICYKNTGWNLKELNLTK